MSYGNQTATAAVSEACRHVPESFGTLDAVIEENSNLVQELEKLLSSVLTPSGLEPPDGQGTDKAIRESRVGLAETVHSHANRVVATNQRLRHMLHRLQL